MPNPDSHDNPDELNPTHLATQQMHEQWHKLCAIIMYKFGMMEVEITPADVENLSGSGMANIIMQELEGVFKVRLVSNEEWQESGVKEAARQAGCALVFPNQRWGGGR